MQMQFGDIKNRFLQFPFILYPSLPSKLIVLNLFIPRQLAMAQMQWSNFSKLNYRNFASSEFFLGAILIFFFCSFITRCSNASNAFDHQRCKKSLAKDIFGSFIRMVFVSTKSFCPALDCCCPPGQRERERDVMSLGRQHANPLYAQHTSCRSSIHSQPGRLLSNEHKTNDTTTAMDRYEGTRRT